MVEDDMAGRMAGAMEDIEREVADRDRVAVDEPAIRLEGLAGDAVFMALGSRLLDPETVLLMRSLDGDAKFLREDAGLAAMIDVAVRN